MNILFVLFKYTAIGYLKNSLIPHNQSYTNNILTYKRTIFYYLNYLCIEVMENLLHEFDFKISYYEKNTFPDSFTICSCCFC